MGGARALAERRSRRCWSRQAAVEAEHTSCCSLLLAIVLQNIPKSEREIRCRPLSSVAPCHSSLLIRTVLKARTRRRGDPAGPASIVTKDAGSLGSTLQGSVAMRLALAVAAPDLREPTSTPVTP